MDYIELKTEHGEALYNGETRIVAHLTRNKVLMECEMPSDWAKTRIFQFMDSLLKANETII